MITRERNNLLNLIDVDGKSSENGLTYSVKNGVISISGTPTKTGGIYCYLGNDYNLMLLPGTYVLDIGNKFVSCW